MAEIDHELFRIFRRGLRSENKDVKDLIEVKNNVFYLYDVSAGDILVTNSSSFTGLFELAERYQVFEPRIRIYGRAKALRASENNIRVAVLTELGLYIVYLPHIWTCLMLPPTRVNYTTCEVWMVNPEVAKMHRVFIYEVLQVRWHPRVHNYLLALYNDNFLRLLDTKTQTYIRALSLGRHPTSYTSTLLALHEHTVDFDFAPIKNKAELMTIEEAPLFLLSGTGDVSYAVLTKNKTRLDEPMPVRLDKNSKNRQLVMPANMVACSLLVLPCKPTILVISSKSGVVNHCILLGEGPHQYLKVIEEYDLCSPGTKKRLQPYLLTPDQASTYRYFVLHAAGVHAVMLPLIPVLEHLMAQRMTEDIGKKLKAAVRETESEVRHLVNMQIPELVEPRPTFGVGTIPVWVTSTRLLVLLADGHATLNSVDSAFPPISEYLNKPVVIIKQEPRKQFSTVLSDYLFNSKNFRTPIKVGDTLKDASPEETLQFLRNYFSNLKENRIKKHTVVAELIDAKVRDITIEYDCQLKQLQKLRVARENLHQHAERIAEQYEESNDKHIVLQKRLELFGLRINAPGRAVSEEKMRKELVMLKDTADKLQFALKQTQALYEHRKTQEQNPNLRETHHQPIYLNEQRRKQIKQSLKTVSESIQEMKDKLNRLDIKLNFLQ